MASDEHEVWDRSVRVFHWLNFACVVFLSFAGTALQYTGELGLSLQGNLWLKTIHVLVGYLFALNLIWRIIWGFTGSHYARWRQILPFGPGFATELLQYARSLARGNGPHYLGHNPLGRLSVAAMLLVLLIEGASGVVLAGTDVYMPPLGHSIARYIAAPGIAPSNVKPHVPDAMGSKAHADMMATVNPKAYSVMVNDLRRPSFLLHHWGYYVLLLLIGMHIVAVVMSEIGKHGGIVSAMFSGRKSTCVKPVDLRGAGK